MNALDVLKSYVLNKNIDFEIDDDLLRLLKEQNLQGILYLKTLDDKYKSLYVSSLVLNQKFNMVEELLRNIFDKNNISYIFLKGANISHLYPDPEIRTRSDIDIYISFNDYEKAKKILLDNSFCLKKGIDSTVHKEFLYENITVELHYNLFDKSIDSNVLKFYSDPFKLSYNYKNFEYRMSDTYHFIYAILHFKNHLRLGAGLRYLMDFYYMLQKTNIDKEKLSKYIKKFKLEVLFNNILNALYDLFGFEYISFEPVEIQFFYDYLMSYGIHGQNNNDSNYSSVKKHKIKYILSRVFLTNKPYRISVFPRLGKHIIFWPMCFIIHLVYLIIKKTKKFFILIFKRNKRKDIYKKLGV